MRLLDLLPARLRRRSSSAAALSSSLPERRVGKVVYPHRVNVYRSEPRDANISHCPCFTLRVLSNHDLRDYLVTRHPLRLSDLPPDGVRCATDFQLWKENELAWRAFFFFDILFGESEEVDALRHNGFVFVRNTHAREWEDYDVHEAIQRRITQVFCPILSENGQ